MSILIDSNFYGGAITVIEAKDPRAITLALRADTAAPDIAQWFHFRLYGQPQTEHVIRIINAGKSAYPGGWTGYRACVSGDGLNWFRTATDYDGEVLTIRHTPAHGMAEFAYFAPYTGEDTRRLLGHALRDPRSRLDVLGQSVEGQPLQRLRVREGSGDRQPVWITARQHPGETQGGYFLEGFLARLLDASDPLARAVLQTAEFHIVADINPDGTRAGNLRTNAAGTNLNREWSAPSLQSSPEVLAVSRAMRETGASIALDVHGDEALPYVFIVNPDDVPGFAGTKLEARRKAFDAALMQANGDFQTERNYPPSRPDHASTKKQSPWAIVELGALGMTLEMPFKDNANRPDLVEGWSPARCRRLGFDMLSAMAADLLA